MASADPYATFKSAFEEQRLKIETLHERISKLEEINNEVVSFVKRNGNLPTINEHFLLVQHDQLATTPDVSHSDGDSISGSGCTNKLSDVNAVLTAEDSLQPNTEELTSDMSNLTRPKSGKDHSQSTVDLLSDIVQQQTVGLRKALESLGLNDHVRDQLLTEIRTNMSNILATQLEPDQIQRAPFKPGAAGIVHPACAPLQSSTLASSGGDRSSSCSSLPAPVNSSHSSPRKVCCQPPLLDMPDSTTPVNSLVPNLNTELHERRRRELSRLNKRAVVTSDSSTCSVTERSAVSLRDPRRVKQTGSAIPIPVRRNLAFTSPGGMSKAAPPDPVHQSKRSFRSICPTGCSGVPMHSRSSSAISTDFLCPCLNRNSCPLSTPKQHLLATDLRVQRGFTLVIALFRGRFVRQLLATHKVYDLIRTVKDTAKLALSIYSERQSSTAPDSLCDPLDQSAHFGQLTSEELILESRLLTQLRSALGQLHDIFFRWPISNQLELLRLSRSLPQRPKRVSVKAHRDDLPGSDPAPVSDSNSSGTVHRAPPKRWQPADSHIVTDELKQDTRPKTRVLRQLQPHEVDRFGAKIMASQSAVRSKEKCIVPNRKFDGIGLRRQSQGSRTLPNVRKIEQPVSDCSFDECKPITKSSSPGIHSNSSVHAASTRQFGYRSQSLRSAKENANPVDSTLSTRTSIGISVAPAYSGHPCTASRCRDTSALCNRRFSTSSCKASCRATRHSDTASQITGTVQFRAQRSTLPQSSTSGRQETNQRRSAICRLESPKCEQSPRRRPLLSEQSSLRRFKRGPVNIIQSPHKQTESGLPVNPISDRFGTDSQHESYSTTASSGQPFRQNRGLNGQSHQPFRPRRPISGPLGLAKQNANSNCHNPKHTTPSGVCLTGFRYPVRKRIVATRNTFLFTNNHSPQPPAHGSFNLPTNHHSKQPASWQSEPATSEACSAVVHSPTLFDRMGHCQLRATWSLEPTDRESDS